MKLILKNFKCWQEKTVDLGEHGISFLNGPSGVGKTSIFDAINFAITGDGRNLTSYGSNSLRVELVDVNYQIIRTKRPNRLIFKTEEKEYEDDEAQEHINKIYSNLFSIISYINQNDTESFFKMSPTEKLEFLESLAFKNICISEKKTMIKDIIKERTTHLTKISSKLESTTHIMKNIKSVDKPCFPVKCELNREDEVIEKYTKLAISKPEKLNKVTKSIITNEQKLLEIKNNEEKINILQNEINAIDSNIHEVQANISNSQYNQEEYERLIDKNKMLNNIKKYIEILNGLIQDKNILENKKSNILEKLKIADISFPDEKEDEVISILSDLNEYLQDITTLQDLNDNIKVLNQKLDNYKQNKYNIDELTQTQNILRKKQELYMISKILLCCPECNSKLTFVNGLLQKFSDDVIEVDPTDELLLINKSIEQAKKNDENIKLLTFRIDEVNKKIHNITEKYESLQTREEVLESKNYYENYLKTNKKLKRDYDIEKESNTKMLKNIENDINQIIEKEKYYNSLITIDYNEDEHNKLIELIESINYFKKNYEKQVEMLRNFENRLEKLTIDLNHYKQSVIDKNSIIIEIKDLNIQKSRLEEEISKIIVINERINEYLVNKKEYDNWLVIFNEYKKLETEENIAKNSLNSINLLKDKFMLAESIYLNTFIKNLCEKVQSYVNLFFIDDPMTITIKPFKTVKKDTKPQINIDINYKGMECDIQTLSGGERDRLNLAFILSFSEIMESPILLLDECISSLDYINFNNVLTSLKENYKGNMILLISHQANEGVFDKIINLP
jgi:exonuclease SbcC